MTNYDKSEKEKYISYVLGKIETYLEGYSVSSRIPFGELARIVAEFLSVKASGELLGHTDSMPALPANSGRVGRPRKEGRTTLAKVEIPSSTHGGMWTPEARAKISKSMKAAWARRRLAASTTPKKPHWTQTAKGRRYMAERAKKFWKEGTWKGRAQK